MYWVSWYCLNLFVLQLKSHIFSGLYAIEISHRAGSLEPKYLGVDKKVVGGGNS